MTSAVSMTELQPHPESALAQLGFVDVAQSPTVGVYTDMVRRISTFDDPRQVMTAFFAAIRQAMSPTALVTATCRGMKPGHYKVTRQVGYDGVNVMAAIDPWRQRDELATVSGGFIGKVISTPAPKLSRDLRVIDDPVLGDWLAQHRSMIAIPAFLDGAATNWAIMLRREPDGFTLAELEESILRANLIGATINNVIVNNELRRLNEQMDKEVERIGNIQRALLPRQLPEIAGLKLAANYDTYDRAGGDMYDFVSLTGRGRRGRTDPAGRWGVLVADVSGHGPSAAVVMAMTHAILHAYPKAPDGPAELLNHTNRHLCAKRIEDSFVTALLAIYDPPTRRLTIARAGHPLPILMSPGRPLQQLDARGGIPLGVLEDTVYEQEAYQLEPGQSLVCYTDGISESMNAAGDMFGVEGIERALADCSGEPDCVIDHITRSLRQHEAGQRPADDQTIVALRVV